jgi:hypothetical protein
MSNILQIDYQCVYINLIYLHREKKVISISFYKSVGKTAIKCQTI